MPFPTVKSDPFKPKRRRRDSGLWSAALWKRLVDQAQKDMDAALWIDLSPECVRMIGDMNEWMYGKR